MYAVCTFDRESLQTEQQYHCRRVTQSDNELRIQHQQCRTEATAIANTVYYYMRQCQPRTPQKCKDEKIAQIYLFHFFLLLLSVRFCRTRKRVPLRRSILFAVSFGTSSSSTLFFFLYFLKNRDSLSWSNPFLTDF